MKDSKNYVDWEDRLSIGVPIIDSQHKQLIAITNELHNACQLSEDVAKDQFRKTLHDAIAYVKYHFSVEEQVMEKTAYPELAEQKKYHAEFKQEVQNNVAAFEGVKEFIPGNFVNYLRDWILFHIAIIDCKTGKFLAGLNKTGKLNLQTMKRKNEEGTENKIILAVDDSKTQLTQLKNILSMYDIFTCESPLQALNMVQNMEVDLILLDLAMEEMTGFEFLHHLRKDREIRQIPVIIISANNTEKQINASLENGADDYIVKPVKPELLLEKIENKLNKPGI